MPEFRGFAPLLELVVDLTGSALLVEARQGRLSGIAGVVATCPGDGTLVFNTIVGPESFAEGVDHPESRSAEVTRMVWDNSALGRHVEYAREGRRAVQFALGLEGVYEFRAVGLLLRRVRQPGLVWAALDGR